MPNALAATNRTGYPLQTALEALVRGGQLKHRMSVRDHEYHWQHPVTGESHFLDLLLSGVCTAPMGMFALRRLLAVECKRIDGYWTFPIAVSSAPSLDEVRLLTSPVSPPSPPEFKNWAYGPDGIRHAEYCALSTRTAQGAEQNDSRTLEPWASELVAACQALASQVPASSDPAGSIAGIIYVPTLVTTATLHVLQYDPRDVSLSDGRLPPPPQTTEEEVPYIVLSKDLGFEPGTANWPLPDRRNAQPHQDVFVVNAAHFEAFLLKSIGVEEGRA